MSSLRMQYQQAVTEVAWGISKLREKKTPISPKSIHELTGCPEDQVEECISQDTGLQALIKAVTAGTNSVFV